MSKIFTIGDSVMDILFKDDKPMEALCGGSSLNASITLGRLGAPVSLVSQCSSDVVGEMICKFLTSNKVSDKYVTRVADLPSNLALAFLDNNNDARYSFYKNHKGDSVNYPTDVNRGDIILLGSSFAIRREIRKPLVEFLNNAREKGALIIYDPNIRCPDASLSSDVMSMICENMSLSHLVKGSNEDFQTISQKNCSLEVFQWMQSFTDAALIYTANKHGVDVHSNSFQNHYTVPSITPLSTIGAGDTFNAAMAYYLWNNSIDYTQIHTLNSSQWQSLVSLAVKYAQKVCESYDNYY